jgi:hypothetical protein
MRRTKLQILLLVLATIELKKKKKKKKKIVTLMFNEVGCVVYSHGT